MPRSSPEDMALMNRVAYALFGSDPEVTQSEGSFRAEVVQSGIPNYGYGPTPAQAIANLVTRRLEIFQG